MPRTLLRLEYRQPGKLFCWTCPKEIDQNSTEWYMNRADNPVTRHPRCEACNDVLLLFPQPSVAEQLERVDLYLSEVTTWTGISTVDELSADRRAVLERVAALAGQARAALRDLRNAERRAQIAVPMTLPTNSDEVRQVFPDPAAVDPLVPMYGVVRCGVCGEPLQKAADRDAYECPTCAPLYDRDKHKGEDYRRGGSR